MISCGKISAHLMSIEKFLALKRPRQYCRSYGRRKRYKACLHDTAYHIACGMKYEPAAKAVDDLSMFFRNSRTNNS